LNRWGVVVARAQQCQMRACTRHAFAARLRLSVSAPRNVECPTKRQATAQQASFCPRPARACRTCHAMPPTPPPSCCPMRRGMGLGVTLPTHCPSNSMVAWVPVGVWCGAVQAWHGRHGGVCINPVCQGQVLWCWGCQTRVWANPDCPKSCSACAVSGR